MRKRYTAKLIKMVARVAMMALRGLREDWLSHAFCIIRSFGDNFEWLNLIPRKKDSKNLDVRLEESVLDRCS